MMVLEGFERPRRCAERLSRPGRDDQKQLEYERFWSVCIDRARILLTALVTLLAGEKF